MKRKIIWTIFFEKSLRFIFSTVYKLTWNLDVWEPLAVHRRADWLAAITRHVRVEWQSWARGNSQWAASSCRATTDFSALRHFGRCLQVVFTARIHRRELRWHVGHRWPRGRPGLPPICESTRTAPSELEDQCGLNMNILRARRQAMH